MQIFISGCVNFCAVAYLHPHLVFDTGHLCQSDPAFFGVAVLDHEGRLPVTAVRDQRVVGGQFFLNFRRLKYALDAQHFLHLVLHSDRVFEVQGCVFAQVDLAVFLVRDNLIAKVRTLFGVLLKAPQVVAGEFCVRCHRLCVP